MFCSMFYNIFMQCYNISFNKLNISFDLFNIFHEMFQYIRSMISVLYAIFEHFIFNVGKILCSIKSQYFICHYGTLGNLTKDGVDWLDCVTGTRQQYHKACSAKFT